MKSNSEFLYDIKRYRIIMAAGIILVFLWGFFFENFLQLKIPYYQLVSLEIFICAALTFVPRLTKYSDIIYTINSVIALAHHGYLVIINDTHYYFVVSSSLALLIAIFPLKKTYQIRFIFSVAILFSISLLILNYSIANVVYLSAILSFSLIIYLITTERNKLFNQILADFEIIETERQKAIGSAKMAALGEMSSGIAHEINNPLAILQGNISIIKKEIQKNPEISEKILSKLNSSEATIERISKIIKGLKAFSRDSKDDDNFFDLIKLRQVLEDTLSFCESRFINHHVQFIYDINEWDLIIKGHSTQLSQVLLNLLNNSFDAIEFQEVKIIRLHVKVIDRNVQICVEDNGPGIPQAIQEKIMQPFFTTKEVGRGTGLGLSISQGIIKKHGGELKYLNRDRGAQFVITLPLEGPVFN